MREPSATAAIAAEILEGVEARWALMGALAALRYRAEPRFTTDVDILVERLDGLHAAFTAAGYDVRETGEGETPDMLLVRGRGDRIDLLVANVDYLETALARATDHVITVEDVVVQKLIAWRARDRDDIASILDARAALDDAYIERWVGVFDVADRWAQVRARRE
ncbi:MAG TPA: hypothetical protein VFA83_21960 [Acidimicrobiales bacterium]|nr:hypothetical protein [Acidimicrobiales bacterium]